MTVSNDPPQDYPFNDLSASTSEPGDDYSTTSSQSSAGVSATKDTAQAEAQKVKDTAAAEAQQMTQTVKEQTQAVTSDVRQQTRQLVDQSRGQLNEQAVSQRDRAVGTLRSLAGELSAMADNAPQSGLAQQLTREGGDLTHKAADFLEQREPAQLLDEVRDLARRRPGTFLIGAAIAGAVGGRLARGAKSARSSSPDTEPSYSATGSPLPAGDMSVSDVPVAGGGYAGVHPDPYDGDVVATPASGYPAPYSDPVADPGGLR